jgi:2,3-bisphosphoglycerate-independent phosphoglycerate mutase
MACIEAVCRQRGAGRIASVIGRYYAMARDQRWERTEAAVDLLCEGAAEHRAATAEEAVRAAYERGETDEFITATAVGEEGRIRPGDSVLAFNFRPDRMRQLTTKLAEVVGDRYTTLTQYDEYSSFPVVFPPHRPAITIGRVIAAAGRAQLHVAETEKYPHVTYFFNGGEEEPYAGEVREMPPSPRDVPTYDHKPEMSAPEATEAFLRHWGEQDFAFAIINYANADMVGHTGVIEAAVTAVETVDACLGRIVEAVHGKGGACIVTADHGNADEMLEEDGSPDTAHSLNPVPFVVTAGASSLDGDGILADVAPTALALLGIEQPSEMTGRSLLA